MLRDTARRVKHALEPRVVRQDRRDKAALTAILAATLDRDSCCVDVGANVGEVLAEIVRVAPSGRHVAFEPLPALADDLARRFPSVDVRCAAVSDEAARSSFVHVVSRPGWSGLVARPMLAGQATEPIEVDVVRLDDALPDGLEPRLVKIDVEGAELGVLRGARSVLGAARPLLVLEHGLGSADVYGTHPRDVFGFLDDLGYRVFGLDGEGPYTGARFEAAYFAQERVNFLARV